MTIHFISDLHLTEQSPHLIRLFEYYLDNYATAADELYILGDLFEYWVGDDYRPAWIEPLIARLNNLSDKGIQLYFCHGNRDFLVGNDFCQPLNIQLLPDYKAIDTDIGKVLLCHGDTFCTDDVPYQEFRAQVRNSEWQNAFLHQPLEQRIAIVEDYRRQSKEATAQKQQDIMDVNPKTVSAIAKQYEVPNILHGHTHRPAVHAEQGHTRYVLADWGHLGQFAVLENKNIISFYFDLKGGTFKQWNKP